MEAALPLAGLTVVELHAIGPVPFAGIVVRQLGARVTRVSPPDDPGLGLTVRPEHDLLNIDKEARLIDLKDRPVIEKILTHLGLDPRPPPRGRAREPGQD